ncbi:MAG: tetratricopeptide repeat protein [Lachnospiraceae bacterium]|nr:tetratricopeptide repeat protein [Candidatus Merdinaster equi]
MFCYNCGHILTSNDFCTHCGAEVRTYKSVMLTAERYYNIGYERAKVRDLSGAAGALRMCLKLNKDHVDARNLLGLIYMETGEIISALNEWIMSKNVQPKKNVADDFLDKVRSNPTAFEEMTTAVKKYNLALSYCYQDSMDLAVIQLRKVLSLSPKFLQAHQLLALVYMHIEEYDKAARELERCAKIDKNNTLTLHYQQELDQILSLNEDKKDIRKPRKKEENDSEAYEFNTYNPSSSVEPVIKPLTVKENTGISTIVNIIIGCVIGIAVSLFLIMPGRIQQESDKMNAKITEYSEQLSSKEADIQEKDAQIQKLEDELDSIEETMKGYTGADGTLNSYGYLLTAVNLYMTGNGNSLDVANALANIDENFVASTSDESFLTVYNELRSKIGAEVSKAYYDSGVTEYNSGNYSEAVRYFQMSYAYNEEDSTALYQLGEAYYRSGDLDNAINTYNEVIEKFPGMTNAYNAQKRLNAIEGES